MYQIQIHWNFRLDPEVGLFYKNEQRFKKIHEKFTEMNDITFLLIPLHGGVRGGFYNVAQIRASE